MEAYVIETPIGVFICDETGKLVERFLFSPESGKAAPEFKDFQEGKIAPPVLEIVKRASGVYSQIIFESEAPAKTVEREAKVSVTVRSNKIAEELRNRLGTETKDRAQWLREQALESPNVKTARAYNDFARQVALQIARVGVARAASKRDLSAVQAVRAMDDLDKTLNLLAGRVREWYGLHFPELDRLVERHDSYAHMVAKLGNRRNFTPEALEAEGIPKEKSAELAKVAARVYGCGA